VVPMLAHAVSRTPLRVRGPHHREAGGRACQYHRATGAAGEPVSFELRVLTEAEEDSKQYKDLSLVECLARLG
jgi:hypothetical protein